MALRKGSLVGGSSMASARSLPRRPLAARRLAGLATLFAWLAGVGPAGATVTGVCPDGSMFIVKKEADIPCRDAKQVEPHEMPPIRPAYLPRPYAWEVFQAEQDPNNPYNLVDRARAVRAGRAPEEEPEPLQDEPLALPGVGPGAQPAPTPAVAAGPPGRSFALSESQLRDLAQIVSLVQEGVPARFERNDGASTLAVELAYSKAFEARLHEFYAHEDLGPALLFTAQADAAASFHPNFTFVQGHAAFHPEREDPRQLGILEGAAGGLGAGETLLGYVVLPTHVELGAPIDVYWDDQRISVTLRP